MKRIVALIERPNHVCYRYRIAAYRAALAERGWQLDTLALDGPSLGRTWQLRRLQEADVVVLQRKLLPLWQLHIVRRWAPRLVFDFDDAVFCRDSAAPKGTDSKVRLLHFWASVVAADAVTAGNEYLAAEAVRYVDPDRVYLLPTCIDPTAYPSAPHHRVAGHVQVAWIGQRSTLPYLEMAGPALRIAAEQLSGLTVRVICDRFPKLPGLRLLPRAWSVETEAADLAEADIGLSWLPDDAWSRGKCGLKILQYMAAGLPVVANPVGVSREMVLDGETGFLAESPGDAARAIVRLAGDAALRRRMGAQARRFVCENYSVARHAPAFAQLIERLHASGTYRARLRTRRARTTVESHSRGDSAVRPAA